VPVPNSRIEWSDGDELPGMVGWLEMGVKDHGITPSLLSLIGLAVSASFETFSTLLYERKESGRTRTSM
jgi:hypothetical protein